MSERPKVRYEYWKANPVEGKPCWSLHRINSIGQAWGIAVYFSEEAVASAAALLNHLGQYEDVHLYESL